MSHISPIMLTVVASLPSLILNSPVARAASYNFSKVADSSGPLSGFMPSTADSGLPSINVDGTVAFWAAHDAGGSGMYRGVTPFDAVPPGTDWLAVAVTGGTYSDFNRGLPVINNLNQVAFRANKTAGGFAIFRNGTSIASSSDGFTELNDSPAINPTTGTIAARGSKVITFPFSDPGFWTSSAAGSYTTVATGTSGISSDGPSVNSLGQVAWIGTYGPTGVHVATGGSVTNWVNTLGIFSGFDPVCSISSPSIVAEPVKVAFKANLDAGGSGIYTVHLDHTGFVVTPIATDPSISVFGAPSINGKNRVVFRRVTPDGKDGLYTGADTVVDRVVKEDDVLDGKTVSDVRSSKQAINDSGRIAFRVTFSDGTGAIYKAVPCPADVTGDHTINTPDLLGVIGAWGASSGVADINRDGLVNTADLLDVINGWGPCPTR